MENFKIYEQLLNLPELQVTGVDITGRLINVSCELKTLGSVCPNCGKTCFTINQSYIRRIRDLNMGERQVYLDIKIRQFYCKSCNRYFSETLAFADLNESYTLRQKRFIFCVAEKQSYTAAGAIVDVHAKTVERIVLSYGEKQLNLPERYARVKRLGIDEHSHRKGKKDYLCILTDLDSGTILDILPDRKKETLVTHFQAIGEQFCQQITEVSCDLWEGFMTVCQTCFPQASLVLDRFHVTKLLNNCIDDFRKKLRKKHQDNPAFKKLKWVLFKQYHTLSDEQLDTLDLAFEQCPLLKQVYFHRDRFHQTLDNNVTVQQALIAIEQWIEETTKNKLNIFDKFVKTLSTYKNYIANYVVNNLSNAATEGLNNLIRSVRRFSFGLPNFQHLRLRVLILSS